MVNLENIVFDEIIIYIMAILIVARL